MIFDFISNHRKGLTTFIIIVVAFLGVRYISNSLSKAYFRDIESSQYVSKAPIFSISDALDGAMGAKRLEIYGELKSGDKIEGAINGIKFKGTFKYCISWDDSLYGAVNQDVMVITINKFLSTKTYKIPVQTFSQLSTIN